MAWKIAVAVIIPLACAIVVLTVRHRRPARPKLGEVSTNWIAEHQSGADT